jgi:hypothetical protein
MRYYFDIRGGEEFSEDEDGVELEDLTQAQLEAAESFAEVSKEFAARRTHPLGYSLSVEVRDSSGPLFDVAFRFATRH